jgi:alpha-beta hydrolase superfamily lysophospholipase
VTRSALRWHIQGEDLVGTLHAPPAEWRGEMARSHELGVLLLNAGPAPRAGNSDLSVHIADRVAQHGVPVFRFDFAGLGDSTGATPLDKDVYWRDVLAGRNDEATFVLVRRIKREFRIARLVIGGLCAAAVPALRTADRDTRDVAGVILLEPAVHLTMPRVFVTSDSKVVVEAMSERTRLQRALSAREWLLFLTGENRFARALRPMRTYLLDRLKASVGHTLPTDANVALVRRWQGSLLRGVPTLTVVAQGQRADGDLPRILQSLQHRELVSVVRIPETNHILTGGSARDTVVGEVERWLTETFSGSITLAAQPSREF